MALTTNNTWSNPVGLPAFSCGALQFSQPNTHSVFSTSLSHTVEHLAKLLHLPSARCHAHAVSVVLVATQDRLYSGKPHPALSIQLPPNCPGPRVCPRPGFSHQPSFKMCLIPLFCTPVLHRSRSGPLTLSATLVTEVLLPAGCSASFILCFQPPPTCFTTRFEFYLIFEKYGMQFFQY